VKPVTLQEILPLAHYERVRPRLRPLFIAEKDRRRLAVGEHLTLLFENGQTVWYQVHEMVRAERMTDDQAIQNEIDTYNELLPRPGELAATLLIEYAQAAERDEALRRLIGLERHMWLVIGEKRQNGGFDTRQIATDQVSAVQFVRFPVTGVDARQFAELANAGRVAVEVDHPYFRARAPITGAIAAALAEDLRQE
jgi:hypothetical protein